MLSCGRQASFRGGEGGFRVRRGALRTARGPASERSVNDVAFRKEVGQVQIEDLTRRSFNRRTALKAGAAAALASQTVLLEQLAIVPSRPAFASCSRDRKSTRLNSSHLGI